MEEVDTALDLIECYLSVLNHLSDKFQQFELAFSLDYSKEHVE